MSLISAQRDAAITADLEQYCERPVTILHLIDSGGLYGAETVLLNLACATQEAGHRPIIGTIVAPQDPGDPLSHAAALRGLEIQPFLSPDGLRFSLTRAVATFAREQDVGVIHTHGYRANIQMAIARSGFIPCPVVATLHGWTAGSFASRLAIYEFADRLLLSRHASIVPVSALMVEKLPGTVGRGKIVVVPNGITVSQRCWQPRVRVTDEAEAPRRILSVGRLSAEKGYKDLVRALASLPGEFSSTQLVIMGEGPERAAIERLSKELGVAAHVSLPGYVADARSRMRDYDLFVLPSYREGLPVVLLEAMAEGLPIVATRVGGVPELLDQGRAGALVAPNDPDNLCREIVGFLRGAPEKLDEFSRNAHDRVAAHYSITAMRDSYIRIYQKVAWNVSCRSRVPGVS